MEAGRPKSSNPLYDKVLSAPCPSPTELSRAGKAELLWAQKGAGIEARLVRPPTSNPVYAASKLRGAAAAVKAWRAESELLWAERAGVDVCIARPCTANPALSSLLEAVPPAPSDSLALSSQDERPEAFKPSPRPWLLRPVGCATVEGPQPEVLWSADRPEEETGKTGTAAIIARPCTANPTLSSLLAQPGSTSLSSRQLAPRPEILWSEDRPEEQVAEIQWSVDGPEQEEGDGEEREEVAAYVAGSGFNASRIARTHAS